MKKLICILLLSWCHIVQAQEKIRFTTQGREKNPNGFGGVELTISGEKMIAQYLKKDKLMNPFEYYADEYRTFRGMPLYFNEDKSIAFALSADKKLLFDFDLRPDRQLIEDVTVWGTDAELAKRENQNLFENIGLFIDAQSTSAFHSQNMNKIVFMGKDVSLEGINPNDQVTSFTLGKQLLYVRNFTDTSLANRLMMRLRKPNDKKLGVGKAVLGTAINLLAGSDDDDGEKFYLNSSRPNYGFWYVLYLDGNAVDTLESQINEDKELPIFQNWTSWRESNLLNFNVFENLHSKKLLSLGTHKLKLEAYAFIDEQVYEFDKQNTKLKAKVAEGEITMEVTGSSMFDLKVASSGAYTEFFKDRMENEMEDSKLIADATKKFTSKFNKNGAYEVRKVVSTDDKVTIVKNEFGRPLRKEAPIFVLVKEKATNLCQVFVFNFVYEFDGVEYDPTGDLWNLGRLLNIGDDGGVEAPYGEPFVVDCDTVK